MDKTLRVFANFALAVVLLLCGLLMWFLTYRATQAHGLAAKVLLPALASARSVTISEHVPLELLIGDGELIPHSVSLSPSQIAELSRAVAGHFDYGLAKVPGCYRPPYHRVEIVLADGAVCNFDISFYCGVFEYEGHRYPLPKRLFDRLRDCFTRFGLPPRSEESYAALQYEAEDR